jgi:uncharacterized phage-associated protein
MRPVRFRFNVEKFVQGLAYFASRGVKGLDKLKAAKLFYYADKYHLLKYARPVFGDTYFCLDHGPIPSASLNIMNEALQPECDGDCGPEPVRALLAEYLNICRELRYPEFTLRKQPDLDVFSDSEIEALEATVEQYGDKTGWQLRNLTHQEPTWTIPDRDRSQGSRADIPYELFLVGQPKDAARAISSVLQAEQENRDLVEDLL